jgi:hypothetical protein
MDTPGVMEDVAARLAWRLDRFAAGLTAQERRTLLSLLLRAMDPIERAGLRRVADVLDPSEESIVRQLEAGTDG